MGAPKEAHNYFGADPAQWNILIFLDATSSLGYQKQIFTWLKYLQDIAVNGKGARRDRARILIRVDWTRAKTWKSEHPPLLAPRDGSSIVFQNSGPGSSVVLQNSTFSGDVCSVGTLDLPNLNKRNFCEVEFWRYKVSVSEDNEDEELEHDVFGGSNSSSFVESYEEMDSRNKWILGSGDVVEDCLFKRFKSERESLAYSWIINVDDANIQELFKKDWAEMKSYIVPWPVQNKLMVKSMARFAGVKETGDLRYILETTSYRPKEEAYDHNKHYDAEWVDLVLRKIKESASVASKTRKNRKRAATGEGNYVQSGRRLDGIIGDNVHGYEYGGIEVAKDYQGTKSTKWLTDQMKLAKGCWLDTLR
ncbi:hypothetical protein RUND412_005907 [Rhizina undulata]